MHIFSFLHKLNFENSFYFLLILNCQTNFSILKIKNYFKKQKKKIVIKHSLNFFKKTLFEKTFLKIRFFKKANFKKLTKLTIPFQMD